MNEIERQILENQSSIMFALSGLVAKAGSKGTSTNLDYQRDMTKRILNPPKQPTIAERTHGALHRKSEEVNYGN